MKFHPVILMVWCLFSCGAPSDSTTNAMKKLKIDELKTILSAQEKWVKVHAAEFLIWEDAAVDWVKDRYLTEQKLYDTMPQYRIGIWRVLHQASSSTAEKDRYLDQIKAAFLSGKDSLHALESLAKLKQPVTDIAPQFADQIFQAAEITSFEIYGLWNLYQDSKMDKTEIIERLLAVFNDPKQSDVNKTIVSYVLRFIEIPKREQKKIRQTADIDSFSKAVQLQFLASILMNFDVGSQEYGVYKEKLLALKDEPDYYTTAILALAAHGKLENAAEIEQYATFLSDTNSPTYSADHHSTANYAWLMYHRLVET